MLTDSKLKSDINAIWNKLWAGGLSNPLDAIEQLSYLIFLKRLDDAENLREAQAQRRNQAYVPQMDAELRWQHWTQKKAEDALETLRTQVFPWFKKLGDSHSSSFTRYMETAEFKINKPSLLIEVCNAINALNISSQNQDVQGDLYEYLLSKLNTSGTNGQFRTPRHIIRMMVKMTDPKKHERIGDLAAGTCGFLVNAYEHILEANTDPTLLEYDESGEAHHLAGDKLTPDEREFLHTQALRGFDSDSGMTMLRIGSMNLMLHGIEQPKFYLMDTLSKRFTEEKSFNVLLMNPPFKGAVDKADVHDGFPDGVTKSELLFVHLMLRALENGGRAAVIVPDGVLFGSSKAHQGLRKKLLEDNRLDGVISMPSGVFKPYAGVSTAVLFFTKGGRTDKVWYYDMGADGFTLDDKRNPTAHNDIPDIIASWSQRFDPAFAAARANRINALAQQLEPLKAQRLGLQARLNELQFESVIAPEGDEAATQALEGVKAQLAAIELQIAPLQPEYTQLRRQFWVEKSSVAGSKYDLSASRYKNADQDEQFFESPAVTLERLARLEGVMKSEMTELLGTLK